MLYVIIEEDGDGSEGREEDNPDPEHQFLRQFEMFARPHLFRSCANKI
jgi:hypothetical protein